MLLYSVTAFQLEQIITLGSVVQLPLECSNSSNYDIRIMFHVAKLGIVINRMLTFYSLKTS